ncbi:hypothetical protein [Paenibacillus tepidiphilus]|uniref:hypothetical protein n=1 Tax=Paenibacillus tepidiphilus TaxID=2608683 RepID=UPI00123AA71E|nr:hypothetical protein [Paenibacillus tepidiphilus]
MREGKWKLKVNRSKEKNGRMNEGKWKHEGNGSTKVNGSMKVKNSMSIKGEEAPEGVNLGNSGSNVHQGRRGS